MSTFFPKLVALIYFVTYARNSTQIVAEAPIHLILKSPISYHLSILSYELGETARNVKNCI